MRPTGHQRPTEEPGTGRVKYTWTFDAGCVTGNDSTEIEIDQYVVCVNKNPAWYQIASHYSALWRNEATKLLGQAGSLISYDLPPNCKSIAETATHYYMTEEDPRFTAELRDLPNGRKYGEFFYPPVTLNTPQ